MPRSQILEKDSPELQASNGQDRTSTSSSNITKSQNTNSWTPDEQRRLEELLVEFPAEAVESQRLVKIAKALGSRTPKQVASRVQKYFKKLHEANLPIPGAMSQKSVRGLKIKKQLRPSTFFPETCILSDFTVKGQQDDQSNIQTQTNSETLKEKTLKLLKRVRHAKQPSIRPSSQINSGYKCCSCLEILLIGSRWSCNDCEVDNDLCADCIVHQLINEDFYHLSHNVILS